MKLSELLKFVKFTHQFQQTKRHILVTGEDRSENDLEHSAQMSYLAWYVISSQKLKLDLDLVLKYCLIHDLVEAYAGDKSLFDKTGRIGKEIREKRAALKIKQQFAKAGDFYKYITKYQAQKDPESRFVKALDKIITILNIYLDGGKSWQQEKITLAMIVDAKKESVSKDATIDAIFWQLIALLKKDKSVFGE